VECPYCQKELVEGYIYGDRYSLKWLPADKKLFLGFARGAEVLPHVENSFRLKVRAYKCYECRKMIINLEK
jgi:hypothetical protein